MEAFLFLFASALLAALFFSHSSLMCLNSFNEGSFSLLLVLEVLVPVEAVVLRLVLGLLTLGFFAGFLGGANLGTCATDFA